MPLGGGGVVTVEGYYCSPIAENMQGKIWYIINCFELWSHKPVGHDGLDGTHGSM